MQDYIIYSKWLLKNISTIHRTNLLNINKMKHFRQNYEDSANFLQNQHLTGKLHVMTSSIY